INVEKFLLFYSWFCVNHCVFFFFFIMGWGKGIFEISPLVGEVACRVGLDPPCSRNMLILLVG
ncbi:hypothetical protein ACN9OK_12095, partial [Glaesserella parasuis]|uniref:hypothetical protein n=1 Tax=Glaesserella parasuis TaxID=738 RepID=UPI003B674DAB